MTEVRADLGEGAGTEPDRWPAPWTWGVEKPDRESALLMDVTAASGSGEITAPTSTAALALWVG